MPPKKPNSSSPSSKKTVKKTAALDLISEEDAPAKSRRQRRAEKIAEEESAKKAAQPKKKAKALDLLDDTPKPKRKNANHKPLPTFGARASAAKTEQDKAEKQEDNSKQADKEEVDSAKIVTIKPPIIVKDLAKAMGLPLHKVMKDLIGMEVARGPNDPIDPDVAIRVCELHGFTFEREKREKGAGVHKVEEKIEEPEPEQETDEERLVLRAPIITFMGHVDHGKTSLLDKVRSAQVTSGEAGGITQHVGAYSVEHDGKPITFLDTPGHAVFSQMRARGANVTDIVVLVVAADDGIMPQTLEALNHAKAAGVTLIVAINKCDLATADPNRVMTQMMDHGLQPVPLGGDIETILVSARTGEGMDELLEMMALQSEVLELKSNPKANARATVIEARTQAGRGATATVIVREGALVSGMPFVCGSNSGKIKSLVNDKGEACSKILPGFPVEVLGFDEMPRVGDELVQMKSERDAKKLAAERQDELRKKKLAKPKRTRLEDLFGSSKEKKTLKIILKGDVQGSVEAIVDTLEEIESEKVDLQILHASAGAITENDILLASASDAVVMGFQVKVEPSAVNSAKREGVQIKLYSIVYELLDQVKEAMIGLLDPLTREQIIGHAEVKQVFKVKKGKAAGCMVLDGKVSRKEHARVLRDGQPVFDGKMSTLRRFQDEVNEVKAGVECGIRLGDFNEYEEGDIIECYQLEKLRQDL